MSPSKRPDFPPHPPSPQFPPPASLHTQLFALPPPPIPLSDLGLLLALLPVHLLVPHLAPPPPPTSHAQLSQNFPAPCVLSFVAPLRIGLAIRPIPFVVPLSSRSSSPAVLSTSAAVSRPAASGSIASPTSPLAPKCSFPAPSSAATSAPSFLEHRSLPLVGCSSPHFAAQCYRVSPPLPALSVLPILSKPHSTSAPVSELPHHLSLQPAHSQNAAVAYSQSTPTAPPPLASTPHDALYQVSLSPVPFHDPGISPHFSLLRRHVPQNSLRLSAFLDSFSSFYTAPPGFIAIPFTSL